MRRLLRWVVTLSIVAVILGLSVIGLAGAVIAHRSDGRVYQDAIEIPARPVAIVPGATVFPSGQPSLTVQDRLDGAEVLYRSGRVEHIVVSGDNRTAHYNEPVVMRNALVEAGIPAAAITTDYAGLDTWDTCRRANEQFGVTEAIFVTQARYAERAAALCLAAEIDVVVLAVDPPEFQRRTTRIRRQGRETLAKVKAFGDIIRRPPARHGGPFIGLVGSQNMPAAGHPPDWNWQENGPAPD